jgi:hypothetical protein
MKTDETDGNATASPNPEVSSVNYGRGTYQKVLDGRKCSVSGCMVPMVPKVPMISPFTEESGSSKVV